MAINPAPGHSYHEIQVKIIDSWSDFCCFACRSTGRLAWLDQEVCIRPGE